MIYTIQAAKRDVTTTGELQKLRSDSKIPAVLYGHGIHNQNLTMNYREFEVVFGEAGTSSLVDIVIDGSKTPAKVLISEIQRDPVTDRFLHVDLHQINMKEKVRTHVNINFVGEAPAVKNLGANMIINKDSIEIECLPEHLIASIDVALDSLAELDASIRVGDLNLSKDIHIFDDPSENLVSVLAPRVEKVAVESSDEAVPEAGSVEGDAAADDTVPESDGDGAKKSESPDESAKK